MNLRLVLATAGLVLAQLRHDPRTVALLVAVPSLLMVLLRYVFDSAAVSGDIAPALFGFFPFLMMFLIASTTMLRERTSGTLERLLTTPMAKIDLLGGYGLAFAAVAAVQVALGLAAALRWASDALPLSYAVDALQRATASSSLSSTYWHDLAVVLGCTVAGLALAAATLRRRTD